MLVPSATPALTSPSWGCSAQALCSCLSPALAFPPRCVLVSSFVSFYYCLDHLHRPWTQIISHFALSGTTVVPAPSSACPGHTLQDCAVSMRGLIGNVVTSAAGPRPFTEQPCSCCSLARYPFLAFRGHFLAAGLQPISWGRYRAAGTRHYVPPLQQSVR